MGRPADFYAKLETSASGRGSPWAARSRKTARRAVPEPLRIGHLFVHDEVRRRYTHRSCAICFLACHPHVGVCVRLKSRWPYHRAGGAPPMAEAMDGKEEIRVVEEPSWTGGSLESLDVIDKVPDESVKLASD